MTQCRYALFRGELFQHFQEFYKLLCASEYFQQQCQGFECTHVVQRLAKACTNYHKTIYSIKAFIFSTSSQVYSPTFYLFLASELLAVARCLVLKNSFFEPTLYVDFSARSCSYLNSKNSQKTSLEVSNSQFSLKKIKFYIMLL